MLITGMLNSCEDFVQVDLPDSRIGTVQVFSSDETALAASSAMYNSMLEGSGILGGTTTNLNFLSGLSSDELLTYSTSAPVIQIAGNAVLSSNTHVLRIWTSAYKTIYECNAILEGVNASDKLSAAVKSRLIGEASFIRAIVNFYLVNLYGDLPLVRSTDYRRNAVMARASQSDVYDGIIEDLLTAHANLTDEYVAGTRTRPNKAAASALLARVYLFTQEYQQAELHASAVIADPAYKLETPANVFLKASGEAIWQLTQVNPATSPTGDAALFVIRNNFFQTSLRNTVVSDFEPNDRRRTAWIGTWIKDGVPYYYAFKYKQRVTPDLNVFNEFLVVLRLAEMYLIRAEARTRLGNLPGAIADLDMVRSRAGLPLVADTRPNADAPELLSLIEHERRIELFAEMGTRWLDLKRSGRITTVLAPLKADWSINDQLYPVPESEILANPALNPQNPGY